MVDSELPKPLVRGSPRTGCGGCRNENKSGKSGGEKPADKDDRSKFILLENWEFELYLVFVTLVGKLSTLYNT